MGSETASSDSTLNGAFDHEVSSTRLDMDDGGHKTCRKRKMLTFVKSESKRKATKLRESAMLRVAN